MGQIRLRPHRRHDRGETTLPFPIQSESAQAQGQAHRGQSKLGFPCGLTRRVDATALCLQVPIPATRPPSPIEEVSELEYQSEGTYVEEDASSDLEVPVTPNNSMEFDDPLDATPRATRTSTDLQEFFPDDYAPIARVDVASHMAQDGHDDEDRYSYSPDTHPYSSYSDEPDTHPYSAPSPPNLDIEIEVEVEVVEESFYVPTSYAFSTPPELSPQTSTTASTSNSSCSSDNESPPEEDTGALYHPFWRLMDSPSTSPRIASEFSPAYLRTPNPATQPPPPPPSPSPSPRAFTARSKSFSAGQRRKASRSEEEFLAHGIMMASRSRSDAGARSNANGNNGQRGYPSSQPQSPRTDYGRSAQSRYPSAAPEKYGREDDEIEDFARALRRPSTAPRGYPTRERSESSDSDDVPLAKRIPSALIAQKSIRQQAREERTRTSQASTSRKEPLEVDLLANKLRQVLQTNPPTAPSMRNTFSQQTPPTIQPVQPRKRLLSLGSQSKRPAPIDSQAHLHLMPALPRGGSGSISPTFPTRAGLSPTFPRGGLSPTFPSAPPPVPRPSSRSRAATISQTGSDSGGAVPEAVLRRARTTREGAAALGLIDDVPPSPLPVPRSRPHSRETSTNQPVPALPTEMSRQRVFIKDMQQYIHVDVTGNTTAEDVVGAAAANGDLKGRDWMLWELSNEFGMGMSRHARLRDIASDLDGHS